MTPRGRLIKPHAYQADPDMPADHNGQVRCVTCHLPEIHGSHRARPTPAAPPAPAGIERAAGPDCQEDQ